jgi:hypothetical protein
MKKHTTIIFAAIIILLFISDANAVLDWRTSGSGNWNGSIWQYSSDGGQAWFNSNTPPLRVVQLQY